MVFQAGKPINIFGTCLKKKEIRIRFNGHIYRFKTVDTSFCLEVPAMPYVKDPFDFDIASGAKTVVIHNCVVGDVYILSGQSNMGFTLAESFETRVKENAQIRFYVVPEMPYANAQLEFPTYFKSSCGWDTCHHESAMKFSAIGYFVSQILQSEINAPIGVILCSQADTSIFSWASMLELSQASGLKKYLTAYRTELGKHLSIDEYADLFNERLPRLMEFRKAVATGMKAGLSPKMAKSEAEKKYPDIALPMGPKHCNRPAGSFETMVSTITPFTVKAVLFYQGEADALNYDMYEEAFTSMVKSWRRAFDDPGLPFTCVQLPGYSYPGISETAIAALREAQANCISFANNIYLTCAADLGEEDNLHPKDKAILSKRLANVVLEKIYRRGKNNMSPSYFSYQISEGQLVIFTEFNNLNLVSRSRQNLGFKISVDGNTFVDTDKIRLLNNQIIIEDIKKVKEIRYCFTNNPHCDIYATNDLPLLPFRIKLEV
jgi:sialate O-acetylesterase